MGSVPYNHPQRMAFTLPRIAQTLYPQSLVRYNTRKSRKSSLHICASVHIVSAAHVALDQDQDTDQFKDRDQDQDTDQYKDRDQDPDQ